MKSLLVDDDPTTIRLLREGLAPHGLVLAATRGSRAIDLFRRALDEHEPFNLVCLDVRLPDRAGYHVLSALRRMERARSIHFPKACILMVSSHADGDTIRTAMTEGCDGYVLKPVDLPSLLARITQLGLIDGAGPAPAAPR